MDHGLLFSVWDSGPWLALKSRGDSEYYWLSLGEDQFEQQLQVWRHSCISIDFTSGKLMFVENGKYLFSSFSKELINLGQSFDGIMDNIMVGCYYRPEGSMGYMSMVGSVSDFHLFGRSLTEDEMVSMTNCSKFHKGDLIN